MKPRLNIVIATAESKNINQLLLSIQQKLSTFEISVAILFMGKATVQDIHSFQFSIKVIKQIKRYLSIAESRNICQQFLQKKMQQQGGIGLILDDDLIWVAKETYLLSILKSLTSKKCDMALCALLGDPPIPKEYTRASPLLDVLLSIQKIDLDSPLINDYLNNIFIGGVFDDKNSEGYLYHDYYSFNKQAFLKQPIVLCSFDWNHFINCLYEGKTTTRPIKTPSNIITATGRERGGATLILNSDVLNYKNEIKSYKQWVSRRSDMVMGLTVGKKGYSLFQTPALLKHERHESFDSHHIKKLIEDIIGYAFVEEKINSKQQFKCILSKRTDRTIELIKETTKMLEVLNKWLGAKKDINLDSFQKINRMIKENKEAIEELSILT
ncbi:MAG: hypothetical protein KAG56_08335 [Sulfurovaceae bacterium]|nr:hypothetical protein [Sulfurovaceae bacterium]